ncbi:MAG: helix-turn-helix domain-containing protein [bacterium]
MGIDNVGLNLKKFRENNGFTQESIAKRLGVSRQAVCMWESGKRELRVSTLIEIADFFDAGIDEIIRPGKIKANNNKKILISRATFELNAPGANEVLLIGDFNSWNAPGIPLKKSKNGIWKIDLDLMPGKYEYKFIIDGKWVNDPVNPKTIINSYGTHNSVKEIIG